MSTCFHRSTALCALFILAAATPTHAGARAVIGDSWSGTPHKLQAIIDATYGPGRIDVQTDYLGAKPTDPDRVEWQSSVWPVMQIREIAGAEHRADFGWYVEAPGRRPSIDGRDDGRVFKNEHAGAVTTILQFRTRGRNIGFYLETPDAGSGQGPRTFFTNRGFNDVGPGGTGALHDPKEGGDIQALVFDVSEWSRPNTWLVCFESRDSGAMPGSCCGTTDNDYADYVFEVRADVYTPNLAPTFGALKTLYRD